MRRLAHGLLVALVTSLIGVVAPFGVNQVSAANTYYLNNGKLKFSSAVAGSIDTTGMVLQPYYYSSSAASWYPLTFSTYPLDMAIGTGTGGSNWTGSNVAAVGALSGLTVTATTWTQTASNGSISTGYGTIVAEGTTTINGSAFGVRNTYELGASTAYVKVTTRLINNSGSSVANVNMWVGTRDDWVGTSDSTTKTRGNIVDGSFTSVSTTGASARALQITSGSEGVLFYSTTSGANVVTNATLGFSSAYNTNPSSNQTTMTGDDSYAMYLPAGTLAAGASFDLIWFYAAGSTAELATVVQQVATASATAPPTPTAGNGQVALTWTAPSSADPITGYKVRYSTTNAAPWTEVSTGSTATSYTVTGLTNGTSYYFQVAALTGSGATLTTGAYSGSTAATAPVGPPGQPTGVSATAGTGQATVSWTAPSSTGGATITGYTATSSPGGRTCSWTTGTLQCVVTGLTNGTAYTFTVTATSAGGTGSASAASAAVTPFTVPSAPSGLASVSTDLGATLTWNEPANNGAAITGYTLQYSADNSTWTTVTLGNVRTYSVSGLTACVDYYFRVAATNSAGTSSYSSTTRFLTFGATYPASFLASNFTLGGSPTAINSGGTITLTAASAYQFGSIWNKARLDLGSSFCLASEINLGSSDGGADGMAFVMQPASTAAGSSGGGLGYAGINPSLAIEFDTYQNSSDPAEDHVGLMRDGSTTHNSGLNGASVALASNIEDGAWRKAQFIWNAHSKTFTVRYDVNADGDFADAGEVPINGTSIDLPTYFSASSGNVYWGFTAATGGAVNQQQVRTITYSGTVRSNASPTIAALSNQSVVRSSAAQSVSLVLSDDSTTQAQWTVTASSSNTAVATVSSVTVNSATAASFTFTPGAATGTSTITVTATDADGASTTRTFTVTTTKTLPSITWATPSAITYGTALSATQLNASSATAGNFVYSPASGTVLDAGSRTLSVTFTPTDTSNFESVTQTVIITVNKKSLAVTSNASVVYGSATAPLSPSYTGLTNGDAASVLDTAPTCSSSYTSTTAVGSLATTCSGGSDNNYSFSFSAGTLTITARPLTVTASGQTITYGATVPTGFTTSTMIGSQSVSSVSYTYRDALNQVVASPSAAGTYSITPSAAVAGSGTSLSNYDITYATGILTINAKAITVTASNQTIAYGASIPTGFTAPDMVSGQSIASVTYTYRNGSNVVVAPPTAVGTYSITPSAAVAGSSTDLANYSITYATGTLTIAKATPTLETPSAISYTDTIASDNFSAIIGGLVGADPEPDDTLTYGITSGTDLGTTIQRIGTYGTLTVTEATGGYTFAPNNSAINARATNASETFTVTVTDGTFTASAALTVSVTAANDAPVMTTVASNFLDTAAVDTLTVATGTFAATDVESNTVSTWGITGATTVSSLLAWTSGSITFDRLLVGTYGSLYVRSATGQYRFEPNNNAINALSSGTSEAFPVTVADNLGAASTGSYTASITAVNDRPVVTVTAANLADVTNGLATSAYTLYHSSAGTGSTPGGEEVYRAFDNSNNTKYLNYNGAGSGVTIDLGTGNAYAVNGLGLTTANDSSERDPTSYEVWGSNDGTSFARVSYGTMTAPTTRFTDYADISFSNSTSYQWYRVVFPTVRGSTMMQIAEIRLPAQSGNLLTYTEGAAAGVVLTGIDTTDADTASLTGATVAITSGLTTGDILSFTNDGSTMGSISGTYDSSTGVLTLSGAGTPAQYQNAFRNVKFRNTTNNPTAISSTRTVTWQANDGNASNNLSTTTTSTITVVETVPTITSIAITSSAGSDNRYAIGETIDVTATFTEPVTVTNLPRMAVNGLTGKYFTYSGGSGTSTLTFTYTVASGDSATGGVGVALNALALNGGTINDSVGVAATITHPVVATSASHIVDGVLPTVASFSTSKSDGFYMAGETMTISATISESVQAGASIDATLNSGATVTLTTASAASTLSGTYTVQSGENAADLTVTGFSITSVLDTAGNAMTSLTVPTGSNNIAAVKAIVIDTVVPTITSMAVSADGRYRRTQAFTVSAVASEAIRAGNTITVTFDTGETLTLTAASAGTSFSGTYTVAAGINSADLTVTAFTIDTVLDTAGNAMTSTTLPTGSNAIGSGSAVIIDTIAPTIAAFTSTTTDGAYRAGQTVNITASSSEAIQSGNSITVTLNSGGSATLTAATAGTTLSGTYTILATHTAADLSVDSFTAGTVTDTAGNAMTATALPSGANLGDSSSIVVDTTAPAVTQMAVSADGWYKAGQTFTVTATVSEPVRSGNSITVTFDTTETLTLTASSAGTSLSGTYSVVAGRNSNDLTVTSFAVNTVLDPAGNAMTSTTLPTGSDAIGPGTSVVVDTTAPTVSSFSTSKANGHYTVGATLTITATISESVQVGASIGATLSSGATLTLTTASAASTLSGTYTVQSGENAADLTVTAFTITGVLDTAGNAMSSLTVPTGSNNIAAVKAIVIDTVAPTITSMAVSANGSYKAGQSLTISATSSEAVQAGNTITVTFDTGETLTLTAASAGTSFSGTYTVAAGINSADLTVTAFTFDTVLDTAGNAMTSTTLPTGSNAIGSGSAVIIDTIAPTITAFTSTTTDGAYKAGQVINITATVSEPIGAGNSISVVLNSGATVTLSTPADSTTWSGGGCGPYGRLTVTGSLTGSSVWGSGPYTDDSDFDRAAVHAGLVAVGQTGVIEPYAIGNYPNYSGTTQNGVSTANWTSGWCGYSIRLATVSTGSSYTTLTGSYTIAAGNTAALLNVASFSIVGVSDGAGNAMTSTSLPSGANLADSSSIVVDTTKPTVTSFSTDAADGAYKAGQTIALTATVSEPILAGNSILVSLNSGATVTLTAASAGTTLGATYTIAAGQNTTDLTVSSFTVVSVADPAANAMTSTTVPSGTNNVGGAKAIVIDTVAPTITAFSSAIATPTNLTTLTYTVNFSEPVTGIDASDFDNDGSAADCVFDPGADSGSSRTLTITLCGGGTVIPVFAANGAIDVAANATQGTPAASTTTINRRFTRSISFATTAFAKMYGDAPFSVSASPSRGGGDGAVSYTVTAGTCSVNASTGEVTITGAGSCTVSATITEGTNNQTATTSTQVTVAIAKKPLTVTASTHAVTYGDAAPTITPAYSAFALAESSSDLTSAPTCSTTYTATSNAASTQTTSCSAAASSNYEFTYVSGAVTIAKQAIPVTFTESSLLVVFDGTARSAAATTTPAGKKVVFTYQAPGSTTSTNAPVNAGFYSVIATIDETNFSGSAFATMLIDKAAQTALTFANGSKVAFGSKMQLVAVGGSGSGALRYAVRAGKCAVSTSGELSNTGAGSCIVRATKAASANHIAAASADLTITVERQDQTLEFVSRLPSSPMPGSSYIPGARASSGLTPVMSISAGADSVCSIKSGVVTFLAKGLCVITAKQAGSANYNAASPITQSITVGTLNQTITFAQPDEHRIGEPPFLVEASSSSGLPVSFAAAGSACSVSSTGLVTILTPGTCDITASQAGNATFAAAASVTRTLIIRAGLPGVPHLMSASPSDSSIVISYSVPPTDGGSPILSYVVVATPNEGDPTSRSDCSSIALTCNLVGLVNGTPYRVKVAAVTEAGVGDFSVESEPVIPFAAPEAVRDLAGVRQDESLQLTWVDPPSLGGGSLVRYDVSFRERGSDTFGSPVPVQVASLRGIRLFSSATSRSATLSGLSKGKTYDIKVVTVTSLSASAGASNTAEAVVQKMNVAEPPRNLAVEATSVSTATVAWATPLRDGGAPITAYTVTTSSGSCPQATPTALSCELRDVAGGATVTITVKATTRVGSSDAATTRVTMPGKPGAPRITSITRKGTSATVEWSAPSSDGGRSITSYRLVGISTLDTKDVAVCSSTDLSCTVEGLSMSAAYNFTARAFNAVGEGTASDVFFVQAFSAIPSVWGSDLGATTTQRMALDLPPAPGKVRVSASSSRNKTNVVAMAPKTVIPITHAIITVAGTKGHVVLRIKVAVDKSNAQTSVTIPYSSSKVRVAVQFANAYGVSAMATNGWKPTAAATRLTDSAANIQKGVTSARYVPLGKVIGEPVYFVGASSALSAEGKSELARIAATIKREGGLVNVTGYSRQSSTTPASFIKKISEQRAIVVANYLASLGVQQWIRVQGVGAPTATSGAETDRRVVVSLTPFD